MTTLLTESGFGKPRNDHFTDGIGLWEAQGSPGMTTLLTESGLGSPAGYEARRGRCPGSSPGDQPSQHVCAGAGWTAAAWVPDRACTVVYWWCTRARYHTLLYTTLYYPAWYYPALPDEHMADWCTRGVPGPGCPGCRSGLGTAPGPALPDGIIYLGLPGPGTTRGLPRGGFKAFQARGKPRKPRMTESSSQVYSPP